MRLNDSIRKDIDIAIQVWKVMLNEYLRDNIDYMFTKGSSAKIWESDIDYVPILSDVDIHIKLTGNKRKILPNKNAFKQSSFFTSNYELLFKKLCKEKNHESFHLPRIQIVQLDFHGRKEYVIPPREKDITFIQGSTTFPKEMEHSQIRRIDKKNLLNEKQFLSSIPEIYFELSGLDYYSLLYRISSRISPSPIRLLTQLMTEENPHDIWTFNKTSIKNHLQEFNLGNIASFYESFYLTGWKLFESGFADKNYFRSMIESGYNVLTYCYEEMLKISEN